ncbi:App1 family protein [Mesonia sp. MT50]|uniref:App1 family protein n=1 Tax=Mesonia profundi TaxID=3070998 RepID=A0ABU1A1Y1_9FLAO|nr:App1 family protein [Mesonia profundi]MDQ7917701.1 App1 family protein [Mesonia profundi]
MALGLKVYRGYANERKIMVFGHVFEKDTPDVFKLNKKWYQHAWQVLRMFRIKTESNASVVFKYKNLEVKTKTLDDGHFRMMIPYEGDIEPGWHKFTMEVLEEENSHESHEEEGEFVKPFPGEYGVISDIDDTFLVSHSGNIFKKLYVMLTRNVNKRKVFEKVVEHYRLLNQIGRKDHSKNNAFFYVSSSEWNLYNFIIQFTEIHQFPKAVLKLKDIKSGLRDFLGSGGGDHNHKFYKIRHLVEFYPELHFILLGDDSQQDPYIYRDISKIFPKNISTIYIRQTKRKKRKKVKSMLSEMNELGVKTCYFKHSSTAMEHSKNELN